MPNMGRTNHDQKRKNPSLYVNVRGKEEEVRAAGVVFFFVDKDGTLHLLSQREDMEVAPRKYKPSHALIGGKIDKTDLHPIETAVRECREETGADQDDGIAAAVDQLLLPLTSSDPDRVPYVYVRESKYVVYLVPAPDKASLQHLSDLYRARFDGKNSAYLPPGAVRPPGAKPDYSRAATDLDVLSFGPRTDSADSRWLPHSKVEFKGFLREFWGL